MADHAGQLTILEQIRKPIEMKFTALDGSEVDLSKLRGKVVLLEFWAVWSPASARALPDIIAAYDKYHAQGFEVIGISMDQVRKARRRRRRNTSA